MTECDSFQYTAGGSGATTATASWPGGYQSAYGDVDVSVSTDTSSKEKPRKARHSRFDFNTKHFLYVFMAGFLFVGTILVSMVTLITLSKTEHLPEAVADIERIRRMLMGAECEDSALVWQSFCNTSSAAASLTCREMERMVDTLQAQPSYKALEHLLASLDATNVQYYTTGGRCSGWTYDHRNATARLCKFAPDAAVFVCGRISF